MNRMGLSRGWRSWLSSLQPRASQAAKLPLEGSSLSTKSLAGQIDEAVEQILSALGTPSASHETSASPTNEVKSTERADIAIPHSMQLSEALVDEHHQVNIDAQLEDSSPGNEQGETEADARKYGERSKEASKPKLQKAASHELGGKEVNKPVLKRTTSTGLRLYGTSSEPPTPVPKASMPLPLIAIATRRSMRKMPSTWQVTPKKLFDA